MLSIDSICYFFKANLFQPLFLEICFPSSEAKLQEVLEDFALPSSPQTLRRALLSRNAQGINAEPPPMHRFHQSSSPVASEAWHDICMYIYIYGPHNIYYMCVYMFIYIYTCIFILYIMMYMF